MWVTMVIKETALVFPRHLSQTPTITNDLHMNEVHFLKHSMRLAKRFQLIIRRPKDDRGYIR